MEVHEIKRTRVMHLCNNKYEADIGKNEEANGNGDGEKQRFTNDLTNDDRLMEMVPASLDRKLNMKFQMKEDGERFKSGMLNNSKSKILAERAAAKAVEAIKDRENLVVKLEGEKQSLEKILEDRAKQQVQEIADINDEIMEATDLEKQKLNNTRIEALVRLSKLATANADLARSLAVAQKNLEIEALGNLFSWLLCCIFHLLPLPTPPFWLVDPFFFPFSSEWLILSLNFIKRFKSKEGIHEVSRLLDENKLIVELADFPGIRLLGFGLSSTLYAFIKRVLYILTPHSPVSNDARSGAVVSLENIDNTGGV
ncbi:golgin candidate 2 [Olea europaea subsp. europaea]|uniref:Golgin candidate 2 n=1 Tax=Olea europaea subsp. europaea TaxID=158383 RepID=A0A8S0QYH4_OLEEU|nr:golgin candidate 2 [Olea europaea subsp. europaea]